MKLLILILALTLVIIALYVHYRPVTKYDVLNAYEKPCVRCREDLNHDGKVDIADLGQVLGTK